MASTSIYIPPELLERLDRLAKRHGTSRNRIIVDACQALLEQDRGEWPDGFFSNDHLTPAELRELRKAIDEMLAAIHSSRTSRRQSPL